MPPDSIPAEFPLQGIDVTVPYDQQPPKTTPAGVNVRARDPMLSRYRGGSRPGLTRFGVQVPGGSAKIQSLGILVTLREDNVISTWDYANDYVADPRNINRMIPPQGNGETPVFGWPPAGVNAYRRQNLTASAPTAVNGTTITLTGTTTNQSGGSFVSGGLVTLSTQPRNRDGSGDTGNTNASGQTTFTVSEPSFTGPVTYYASHEYTRSGQPLPSTARSYVTVKWTPNFTLTLASPEGTSFPADGKNHPLVATLLRTPSNKAVGGQQLVLGTDVAAPGKGQIRFTDGSGKATFTVSDTDGGVVNYTASMPGGVLSSSPLAITWTTQWELLYPNGFNIPNLGTVPVGTPIGLNPWLQFNTGGGAIAFTYSASGPGAGGGGVFSFDTFSGLWTTSTTTFSASGPGVATYTVTGIALPTGITLTGPPGMPLGGTVTVNWT